MAQIVLISPTTQAMASEDFRFLMGQSVSFALFTSDGRRGDPAGISLVQVSGGPWSAEWGKEHSIPAPHFILTALWGDEVWRVVKSETAEPVGVLIET